MSLNNPTLSKPTTVWRIMSIGVWTALLTLATSSVQAFDLNSDTPIKISADNARLDDNQGIATYTGDVVITQLETRLDADQVILYRDNNGISRIEASGSPAHYSQPSSGQAEATNAEARKITYSAGNHQLTFEHNAIITQGNNLFRGELIHYDTENRLVTAEGSAGDNRGRVEIVIQPRNQPQSGN